jgi:hypothetical protein
MKALTVKASFNIFINQLNNYTVTLHSTLNYIFHLKV